MQYFLAPKTFEQASCTQVQQQMAFAVMAPAARAFKVLDVTADHVQGQHQPRRSGTATGIREEAPHAMLT